MTDVYLGQIMMAGFGFAQRYFAQCNGQILPISQNTALFSLLGVQYGGNGSVTFGLPDLRGRVPVGAGASQDQAWQPAAYAQGALAGTETVTLTTSEMPAHGHQVSATTAAGAGRSPSNQIYASTTGQEALYASPGAQVVLNPACVSPAGGSQPHENMQPYLAINFVIALNGIYPSRG
ncbi:tail fiber protein [Bacillus sp. NP157]|nr:tail fiber protein [Bacillus sp. NP157]